LHELLEPSVILRHEELAVVRDALFTGLLVHLTLWFSEVRERQTDV
jgi:hypothetical protein